MFSLIFYLSFGFLISSNEANLIEEKSWHLSCKYCDYGLNECLPCFRQDCMRCLNNFQSSSCAICAQEIESNTLYCDPNENYQRDACTIKCRMQDVIPIIRFGVCDQATKVCSCYSNLNDITTSASTSSLAPTSTPYIVPTLVHLTYQVLLTWEFENVNRTELRLRYRNIKSFDSTLFRRYIYLQWLDLSNNDLVLVHTDSFKGLNHLKHINFSNNKLITIEPHYFNGLQFSLETLLLNNNKLENLNRASFLGFKNLTNLNVDNNPISQIYNISLNNDGSLSFIYKN
ncbi:unnamed protein product [Brachionus calyciflorus]|uniref:Uncharacterized protein n=1 Tax=Brachionus calyciflorus TaxID=104777 RepID=A0A814BJC2_9BILA|nr:unnamed protein product [Brachionus calyciflorus]